MNMCSKKNKLIIQTFITFEIFPLRLTDQVSANVCRVRASPERNAEKGGKSLFSLCFIAKEINVREK